MLHSASIIGTGSYTPEKILTNEYFASIVETSDEWITSRTGIKRRHVVENGMATSEMSEYATRIALEEAGISASDIGMILIGTVTPDRPLPSAAAMLQERIGAINAGISDVAAACAGFIYGLGMARALVCVGQMEHVLVVGAETLTSITNYQDRNTCVLFGDGAGAAIVSRRETGGRILATSMMGDGRQWQQLFIPKGGSATPLNNGDLADGSTCIRMNGSEVYKHAVRGMVRSSERALAEANMTSADVSLFIPHQANLRIMEAVAKRLKIPGDRVIQNIEEYGNTSSASVPIGLAEASKEGRIKSGDVVLLSAFGAGFCWGSAVIQY